MKSFNCLLSESKIIVFTFSFFYLFNYNCLAQGRCAFDHIHTKDLNFENWLKSKKSKLRIDHRSKAKKQLEIPVVFHIIHNGESIGVGGNLSEERIQQQIKVLNEDFNRQNADAEDTPAQFMAVASNPMISFVMARRDPNDNPTSAITRTLGTKASYSYDDDALIKSEIQWPPEEYLNIYIIDIAGSYIGWAAFPESDLDGITEPVTNPDLDGVVLDYEYLGKNADAPEFSSVGRTASHEVGHYLGLLHTWGYSESCNSDDFCEDTPNTRRTYSGTCPNTTQESCGSEDMYSNFMYYTDDECMNIFTACQSNRMNTVLMNSPRRLSLTTSRALIPAIKDTIQIDISISQVTELPILSCKNTLSPIVGIQNVGFDDIVSYHISYSIDDQDYSQSKSTNLITLEEESFEIDLPDLASGAHSLSVNLSKPNDQEDENDYDNNYVQNFILIDNSVSLPTREDFTDGSWLTVSPYGESSWKWESQGGNGYYKLEGDYSSAASSQHWLTGPRFIKHASNPTTIRWKMAYWGKEYSKDRLQIFISDNCGSSFSQVFSQTGDGLNSSEFQDFPSDEDWKEVLVDISDYTLQSEFLVSLVFTNERGGNLYIDDIDLIPNQSGDVIELFEKVEVYPNPAIGQFNLAFNLGEVEFVRIELLDMTGKTYARYEVEDALNQSVEIDAFGLSGLFFIRIEGNTFNISKYLILK